VALVVDAGFAVVVADDVGVADGVAVADGVTVGVAVGVATGTASQYHRVSPENQHWCGSGFLNSR